MKRKRDGSPEDGSLEGAHPYGRLTDFTNPAIFPSLYSLYTYIKNDEGYHALNGIRSVDDSVIIEVNEEEINAVNMNERKLIRADGVDLSEVKHNAIVDLSVDGDRWEGDVLNDEPCGWGVLYDRDNQKVYEGFRVGERNVCYGCKYYSDTEMIEYEGEWRDGVRWGRGVQYDRSGGVVYDGEWLNDEYLERRVVITSECTVFHNRIEELVVNNHCCNEEEWKVLDLGLLWSLKSVRVGRSCFEKVEKVKLTGLIELESVEIGSWSFDTKRRDKESGYCFYLKNCPKLKSLKIGGFSFNDYSVCEIENVDALETIEIGGLNEMSENFKYASLELKSNPDS